jgi:hypothetical protein
MEDRSQSIGAIGEYQCGMYSCEFVLVSSLALLERMQTHRLRACRFAWTAQFKVHRATTIVSTLFYGIRPRPKLLH